MSYSAFSDMIVDDMPLFNHGLYILDKFSEMKLLLSILFSVDERMVILD